MTTGEFSNEFDVLISSFSNREAFGTQNSIVFDEYEKSSFLTKAQENIVEGIYNGLNIQGKAFEETEEFRRYLSSLIKTVDITPEASTQEKLLSNSSKVCKLPSDLWFITYESITLPQSQSVCTSNKVLEVVPVTQDSFNRIKENPFKRETTRRALRLDLGTSSTNEQVEIISLYDTFSKYTIRYIKKPNPIVLCALSDGLSINGVTIVTECELNNQLHRQILEEAVRLALASKGIQFQNNNK